MTSASYDGDGLRQSSASTPSGGSSVSQNYVWSYSQSTLPQVIMDGTNAYIYADGLAPAEQVQLATGAVTYLVTDSLGSVRGAVSSSGSLTGTTSYDAWGNPETPAGLTGTTPFGYAAGYTDPTGLLYLINRYYEPVIGQFISVDPLLAQTQAAYGYGNGNPVSEVDPTGEYGYSYTYWLGFIHVSVPRLVSWIQTNFDHVFPFWGCPNRIGVGMVCRLDGFNPIRIIGMGLHYFEFLSLPGHTEGAWKHIYFYYWATGGSAYMNVHAWGPNDNWCNSNAVCAAGNRQFAETMWSLFAVNIFWHSPWFWLDL
jgi:RHS repeat-associated protein